MRKFILTLLISTAFICHLTAQLTPYLNYQAVARDGSGKVLENKPLIVEVSILQGSPLGTIVWQEGHNVTTNSLGLFTLQIGKGIPTGKATLPAFDSIKWWTDNYYLNVRVDFGNGLVDMGTSQFLAVPYALYAHMSGNSVGGTQKLSLNGHELIISNGNSVILPDNVDDADADPTNEIQTLSVAGKNLSISNGNTVTLNVDDADADPSNEFQTLSLNGKDLSITNGNTVTLNVDDADADTLNEIQTLAINGNNLSISGGNTVALPTTPWKQNNTGIYYKNGTVSINTQASYRDSTLLTITDSNIFNLPALMFLYGRGTDNGLSSARLLHATIDATNGDNTAIYGSAIGSLVAGYNKGISGFASNSLTNYGLFGEANPGVKGTSANYGVYGTSSGTTNNINCGVFGKGTGSTKFNFGLYGSTNGVGTNNAGVFAECNGSGSGQNIGVYAKAQNSGFINYGVLGESAGKGTWNIGVGAGCAASGTHTNYGMYTGGDNAKINYGIYSRAAKLSGTYTKTNYAFYADAYGGTDSNYSFYGNKGTFFNRHAVSIGTETANSLLQVNGSISLPIVTKSAAYTATLSDYTILCDGNSSAFTISLPAASAIKGRIYVIKKTDASSNAITVDGNGSETIDGNATYSLTSKNQFVMIQSDGSGWQVISKN
ncbi:MAG: hypothetical protein GX437_00185 [Sphingobacteriales bacterium]|nr:hypothetical protein [Sphingobacteriales bacterium]